MGVFDFSFRKLVRFAGPSLLMSAAFLDPGNLEADLQLGAKAGFSLLWVLALSTVTGFLVQLLSAKLGTVTGRDLAQLCRSEYPAFVRYMIWVFIELAIICAEIQEVIGSAIAIFVLSSGAVPLWAGTVISVVAAFVFLFLDEFGHRALEHFFAIMVSTMAAAFLYMFIQADVPAQNVVMGFVPELQKSEMNVALGLVGSVLMPYNMFLHSGLVQSRHVNRGQAAAVKEAIFYFGVESSITVLVAFMINASIVCIFATGFFGSRLADQAGLKEAANILSDRFGAQMRYIWAIGLIASGQAAVMAGGMAGQIVMLGFLNLKIAKWKRLLFSRSVAVIPTLFVVWTYQDSNSLDVMNEILNIWQSLVLPVALIPLLAFTSSTRLMGNFKNSLATTILGWSFGGLLLAGTVFFLYSNVMKVCGSRSLPSCIACSALGGVYFAFQLYLLCLTFLWRKTPETWDEPLLQEEPAEDSVASCRVPPSLANGVTGLL